MVIWLFGLSGAGKTTISKYLFKKLKKNNPQIVLIDNDEIREVLGTENLGFDAESRIIKAKKIQKLALMLSNQNLIVIVCVTFSNKEISNWNRENFKTYYEIFLDVSINTVIKRDPKGLYKMYKEGKMKNIVGLDVKLEKPKNFDLKINENSNLEEATNLIISKISELK